MAGSTVGLAGSYTLWGPPEIIRPRAPESSAAGVSLGRTSEYTPRSRTLRAIRWQYCPPASRTTIWAAEFTWRVQAVAAYVRLRSCGRSPAGLWLWASSRWPARLQDR